jgi:hypothetical protein
VQKKPLRDDNFLRTKPEELVREEKIEIKKVQEANERLALKNLGQLLLRSFRSEWGT